MRTLDFPTAKTPAAVAFASEAGIPVLNLDAPAVVLGAFDIALASLVQGLNDRNEKHYAENLSNLTPDVFVPVDGRKYVKICRMRRGKDGTVAEHGSAYAFIDKATGDIFKPASFAAPAKHARGSIYRNPLNCCGLYSVNYLR